MTPDTEIEITAIDPEGKFYPIPKLKAHEDGTFHLAISVFLFSTQGLLLQQRALGKYHSGGLWANACCSHPNWGEALQDCAHRRVREELNLDVDLSKVGVVDYRADVGAGLIENERAHIFVGQIDAAATQIAPNPSEVAQTRWADRATLEHELAQTPEHFSKWFQQYMSRQDAALVQLRGHVWAGVDVAAHTK